MVRAVGRQLPDGLRALLSGGGAGARGVGRGLLDRPAPGDGRRVTGPEGGRLPRRRSGAARDGLARLPEDGRAGTARRLPQLVDVDARRRLAAPGGTGQHRRRAGEASGDACRLRRRSRLRGAGRQVAADRGRVGVRGARRTRRRGLHVGRRVRAEGADDGEHLAGRVPVAEPAARPLRRNLTRRDVPAERLRPL